MCTKKRERENRTKDSKDKVAMDVICAKRATEKVSEYLGCKKLVRGDRSKKE